MYSHVFGDKITPVSLLAGWVKKAMNNMALHVSLLHTHTVYGWLSKLWSPFWVP